MKVLGIDTATDACGVALWLDGRIIARELLAPRGHAALVLPMIEELLAESGLALGALDAIAFGRGPGSFTGVRIATSIAQGLGLGAGLPLVPISDLAALAQGARRRHGATRVIAALDARMGEVYCAAFELDGEAAPRAVTSEVVARPEAVVCPAGTGWFVAGPGWTAHGVALQGRFGPACAGGDGALLPSAVDIAALGALGCAAGATIEPRLAQPVYLRDRIAEPKPA